MTRIKALLLTLVLAVCYAAPVNAMQADAMRGNAMQDHITDTPYQHSMIRVVMHSHKTVVLDTYGYRDIFRPSVDADGLSVVWWTEIEPTMPSEDGTHMCGGTWRQVIDRNTLVEIFGQRTFQRELNLSREIIVKEHKNSDVVRYYGDLLTNLPPC